MDQRHKQILEILEKKRQVKVKDLSESLNTSEVTIRKDLKLLEASRLLFRNHGGASLDNPYVNDRSVNEKEFIHAKEKSAIARAAAKIIENDQFIMIASGTSVLAFAKYINPLKKLTVVTSALNVAVELVKKPNVEVLQLGGYIRSNSYSVIGHYPEIILKEMTCSKLFLSVDGIDLDYGLSTTNTLEAHLNLKMIDSATEVIVLTDSSKFGKRSFGRICGIEQIDHIFTDSNITDTDLKKLKTLGIQVTICA